MLNQKAFNLFTALVSFVMILLAVILTNSMTQTEDKAISTLSDLELQSEMQTVADLARADALQVFVYNLRSKMETWLTKPDNYFPLTPGKAWNQLVNDYVALNFGRIDAGTGNVVGQQFAFEVTQQLTGILAIGTSFGRYSVDLKQNDQKMREALNKTISNSLPSATNPNQTLFELIGCGTPTANPRVCEPGTFYINLDLSPGAFDPTSLANDNAIYESLPKIIVRRVGTTQTLETAILPRSKIRIYVPLRIFMAVFHAREKAEATLFNDTTGIKKDLKELKMGMCDPGCTVRQGDLRNPGQAWLHACPNTPEVDEPVSYANYSMNVDGVQLSNEDYDPGHANDAVSQMQNKLHEIVEKIICTDNQSIVKKFFDKDHPFGASANPLGCELAGSAQIISVVPTKTIVKNPSSFNQPEQAGCARMERLALNLKYTENNDLYRVNQHVKEPYTIRLQDNAKYQLPPPTVLPTCTSTCVSLSDCGIGSTCG